MEISEQCVVGLTWTLKDTLGEVLDVLDEPVEFLVGGDDLFDAIEAALQGHEAGDRVQLQLEPEQAFGDFNDQLLFLEPRALFPDEHRGRHDLRRRRPARRRERRHRRRDALYTVTEIYPEHVVLDGNHPLAGIALRLDLKVRSVREATEDEIGQGTAGTGFFKLPADGAGQRPAALTRRRAVRARLRRASEPRDLAVVDAHAVADAQVAGRAARRRRDSAPLSVWIETR